MSDIKLVKGYVPGSIGRVAELHGTYSHEHWNFTVFFEAKVASELSEFLGRYDEKRDGFWTASLKGRVEGSITIDGIHAEKEECIFGDSLYPMSCGEEVLVIGLLKRLLTSVETKDTGGYISGLSRALTLRDTSTRKVVLNLLKSTEENSGEQRLTNSDLKYSSNSIAYHPLILVNPSYISSIICSFKGYKIMG